MTYHIHFCQNAGASPPSSCNRLLENKALATALTLKTTFTLDEWKAFGISDLSGADSCIQAGDSYFKPAKTLRSSSPLFRELSAAAAGDDALRAKVPFTPVETACNKIGQLTGLGDVTSWVTVLAVDSDKSRATYGSWAAASHAGRGYTVYVSTQSVYVSATTYNYNRVPPVARTPDGTRKSGDAPPPAAPQKDEEQPKIGVWSAILRFDLNSGAPSFAGVAEVDGSIINQFAMDEYSGHLRIASTSGQMWGNPVTSESGITVFDASLALVGRLTGLAPGERIYSVRFMGQRGYVVTYRQVDPFFVFDLSEPSRPTLLGYLKIPGFSDYLHPLSATLMLGVGKETANGR